MKRRTTWQTQLCHQQDTDGLLGWLRERHSLTLRLRRHCTSFTVRCLCQRLEVLQHDEATRLSLRSGSVAWVREVLLCTDAEPAVFAHTAMARHPRHAFDLRFARLGERSLGSLLFADPCIRRGPLEFARLDSRHPLYRRAQACLGRLPARLWARRSLFSQGRKTVLVTELFLPHICALGA